MKGLKGNKEQMEEQDPFRHTLLPISEVILLSNKNFNAFYGI